MFDNTVTLFNYDEEMNEYYPTLLTNVELQPKYKTSFDANSTDDEDNCLLIIRYYKKDENKKVFGTEKTFRTPKLWQSSDVEDRKNYYFTLKSGRDFFAKGNYAEAKDVNYEVFKNNSDGVFFVHEVKDFEYELSHFEVTGY